MYSWGPEDTSAWKKSGFKYDDAKAPYLKSLKKEADLKGERSYLVKAEPDLKLVDPKGKKLYSASENPIQLVVDGTGSMQTWPKEIHDRIPLFYQTLVCYKPDLDVSLSVIGDAGADKWPLQVSDFGKGPRLDDYINALYAEGGGGPGIRESYELFAYFANNNVSTPKATNPFMIIMGDEKFYEKIDHKHIKKYTGEGLQEDLDSMDVWKQLGQKFNIYLLRKSYAGRDEEITAQWSEAIGAQKIIPVYDPLRVVDIAMGIVAKQWGKFSEFEKNLEARQDSKGIKSVMASLSVAAPSFMDMKSKMGEGPSKVKKSKALTEE